MVCSDFYYHSNDTKFHEDMSITSYSKGQITHDDKHEEKQPTILRRIPALRQYEAVTASYNQTTLEHYNMNRSS